MSPLQTKQNITAALAGFAAEPLAQAATTLFESLVLVRRATGKSPSRQPFATIEKLLVELCFEARNLQLMGLSDSHPMVANLAGTNRIQMGTLLSHAAERKLHVEKLLEEENQLIPPFQ